MYRSKTSWNTNLLHFISFTHKEMDTTTKLPNIWREWSRGLKIGSLKWFWYTCSCFHPCRCSNSQKTTFFWIQQSCVDAPKCLKNTPRILQPSSVCIFPGISGPCEKSRREKSCFIPIWVVSSLGQITVSWRWWWGTGQGVKPIWPICLVIQEWQRLPPLHALFCRTFLLLLCNYDIVWLVWNFWKGEIGEVCFCKMEWYNLRLDVMYQSDSLWETAANQKWIHFLYDLWSPIRFVYVLSPGFQLSKFVWLPTCAGDVFWLTVRPSFEADHGNCHRNYDQKEKLEPP